MYKDFAYFYDKLMYDVDYGLWTDYYEKLFSKHGHSPKLILDLACGTGSLSVEFALRGYEVIGIDLSSDMLNTARHKCLENNVEVLLIKQDMRSFELYGTVDAVICSMDSINYLTSMSDVEKAFSLVYNYLNPGGIFIFDINTRYKLENILGNNVFYDVSEDFTYIWQNEYDSQEKIVTFDLTFFFQKDNLYYERFDEVHQERAYSHNEIITAINNSNLKYISSYNELTMDKPSNTSQRVFYVAQK